MDASELLVNVTFDEIRIALVNSGTLTQIYIEYPQKPRFVGNIYYGKVIRVLPNMQTAFVDIGLEKAAFLNFSDNVNTQFKTNNDQKVQNTLYQGQYIVVQVIKDPLGNKSAKLSTRINIATSYLVLVSQHPSISISKKINDRAERNRLANWLFPFCNESEGFIIRSAAEGIDQQHLIQQAQFLKNTLKEINEKKRVKKISLLYQEADCLQQILRDFGHNITAIKIDVKPYYDKLRHFVAHAMPQLSAEISLYQQQPIFTLHNIEQQIVNALAKRVDLKSGGYVIIEQTESVVTIDVNSGAFTGHHDLSHSILDINIEAAKMIANQLQLRHLGGIIIIDFIDMKTEMHRNIVINTLKEALANDKAHNHIAGFTALGLVEMTRKRTTESLAHFLFSHCPACCGAGIVKSMEAIYYDIVREIMRINQLHQINHFIIYTSNQMAEYLASSQVLILITNVERLLAKKITINAKNYYALDQFNVTFG